MPIKFRDGHEMSIVTAVLIAVLILMLFGIAGLSHIHIATSLLSPIEKAIAHCVFVALECAMGIKCMQEEPKG